MSPKESQYICCGILLLHNIPPATVLLDGTDEEGFTTRRRGFVANGDKPIFTEETFKHSWPRDFPLDLFMKHFHIWQDYTQSR